MKKGLKVLGITALVGAVAALVPYTVKKDRKTGETKAKALLWNADYTPKTETSDAKVDVGINLLPDLSNLLNRKKDEPASDEVEDILSEIEAAPDKVEAVLDEVKSAGDEIVTPAVETFVEEIANFTETTLTEE